MIPSRAEAPDETVRGLGMRSGAIRARRSSERRAIACAVERLRSGADTLTAPA